MTGVPVHEIRAGTFVHETSPFNAEPSRAALDEAAITPVDVFSSCNPAPSSTTIRPTGWRLRVAGRVEAPLERSHAELRDGRYPERARWPRRLRSAGSEDPSAPWM